jgi:hypothetical protein
MKTTRIQLVFQDNRIFLGLIFGVLALLLIPLIAMQFTTKINWSIADFVIMGVFLYGVGSALIFLERSHLKRKYPLAIAIIALAVYIWAELAVGVFTNLGS